MFRRLSLHLISITEDIEAGLTASVELGTYFQEQVDQRRSTMTDDVIGDLVAAEIDGEKLTDEAIISFLRLLLPAGLETTYRSSGNLLQLLLTHPDQLEAVQQDRDLIPAAIEEGIRYETPLVLVARNTTRDVEMHGMTIPEGAQVNVCMGSANRDEKRWAEPRRVRHPPAAARAHLIRRRHPQLPRHAPGPGGNEGDAEQPLRSRDRPAAGGRRRHQDRRHAVPLAQAPARDVPARRMKSRAAILHDMGQQWSVEDFELDPPRPARCSSRWPPPGCAIPMNTSATATCPCSNEVMEAFGLPSMFPMIGGHEGVGRGARDRRWRHRVRAGRPRRDVVRRGLRPVPMVQLRHGVHLRHGRAGDDSRYADGRHLPPSHRRRPQSRPPVEGRRVLETHCRFARIRSSRSIRTCRCCRWRCCRAAIPTGYGSAENRAKVRDRRHRRRHRCRAESAPAADPGRTHQRRRADHRRGSGGVQAEVGAGLRCHTQRLDHRRGRRPGARSDPRSDGGQRRRLPVADPGRRRSGGTEPDPQGRHLCVDGNDRAARRIPSRSTCRSSSCGTRAWSAPCWDRAIRGSTSHGSPGCTRPATAARRDDHPAIPARRHQRAATGINSTARSSAASSISRSR